MVECKKTLVATGQPFPSFIAQKGLEKHYYHLEVAPILGTMSLDRRLQARTILTCSLGRAWASSTLAWQHWKTLVYVCLCTYVRPYTKNLNWTNGNEGTRAFQICTRAERQRTPHRGCNSMLINLLSARDRLHWTLKIRILKMLHHSSTHQWHNIPVSARSGSPPQCSTFSS